MRSGQRKVFGGTHTCASRGSVGERCQSCVGNGGVRGSEEHLRGAGMESSHCNQGTGGKRRSHGEFALGERWALPRI